MPEAHRASHTATTPFEPPPKAPRPDRTQAAEDAYPTPLLEAEEGLLQARRGIPPDPRDRPLKDAIGFALSGGGIRSATFCLGFFQGLAKKGGLLRRIDYLSTVSGGGYFGAFLGRLLSRPVVKKPEDAEAVLLGEKEPGVFENLRQNGRFLSPSGSGDLLLGGAILFRNWVSLQIVLWTFLLAGFALLQLVRGWIEVELSGREVQPGLDFLADPFGIGAALVWWSPWLLMPVVVFVIAAFPIGWAYWLVERVHRNLRASESKPPTSLAQAAWRGAVARLSRSWWPFVVVAVVATIAWLAVEWFGDGEWSSTLGRVGLGVIVAMILAVLWWGLASALSAWDGRRKAMEDVSEQEAVIFRDAAVRGYLSRWVKTALVCTGVLLILALIDSLGQSLYLVVREGTASLAAWIGAFFAALGGAAGFARRIAVKFATGPDGERVRLPVAVVATLGAILVVGVLLISLDALSHAVAWAGDWPAGAPESLVPPPEEGAEAEAAAGGAADEADQEEATPIEWRSREDLGIVLFAFLGALAVSICIGRIWPFVNRSSHQPLYSSRLVRAYLGASNEARLRSQSASVLQVLPGDDVDLEGYWPPPAHNAAPIHLVNVTINETVDGRTQTQQQDRKGTGMVIGPCGMSVGVRHHLVAPFGRKLDPKIQRIFPMDRNGDKAYRVFEYPDLDFRGELLPLGAWVGISGAAFTTGTGMRTNLGLSLLAGLANVRLGYWWDSGVDFWQRSGSLGRRLRFHKLLALAFPVQAFLLDELLARFPGTARRHWYLSDGGHFENMGGYELIRRRLSLIVIIDAEADPDYTYEGLANLVRKARLDFKAEIVFMKPEEIDRELPPEVACHVGSLEQLRRGRWKRREEACEEEDGQDRRPKRPAADFEAADRTGRCLVHAALARVIYDDGTQSRLLYVKPSLLGDEPEDVLDYHRQHHDFPQETTADQFFDEAQWESYRRLGQHIAEKIFQPAGTGTNLSPPFWNPGRLECPPEAVTRPKKQAST